MHAGAQGAAPQQGRAWVRLPSWLGSCSSAYAAMMCLRARLWRQYRPTRGQRHVCAQAGAGAHMGVPQRALSRRPCLLVVFWYPGSVSVRYMRSALAPPGLQRPSRSATACARPPGRRPFVACKGARAPHAMAGWPASGRQVGGQTEGGAAHARHARTGEPVSAWRARQVRDAPYG